MKVKEIIFIVEEDPEGGYNARALGESIFTKGSTLDELKENMVLFQKVWVVKMKHEQVIK